MTTQITSPNVDPTFLATLATLTGSQTLSNKGYARCTANFTPPTAAFPDFGP